MRRLNRGLILVNSVKCHTMATSKFIIAVFISFVFFGPLLTQGKCGGRVSLSSLVIYSVRLLLYECLVYLIVFGISVMWLSNVDVKINIISELCI